MRPVTLVILTLNEIDGVTQVVSKLPLHVVDEILVVDGGSSDGTVEFDQLVFSRPDCNEDRDDIPRLVDGLAAGYDTVIASRFMAGARSEDDDKFLFASRRWGNLLFTWLANVLCGRGAWITDTTDGYRAC